MTVTVAYVVGGVGIAGVALGAVAGGRIALSRNHASTDVCPDDGVCRDPAARSDSRAAGDWATVSTVGFIAGAALLAAGESFTSWHPDRPPAPPRRSASVLQE